MIRIIFTTEYLELRQNQITNDQHFNQIVERQPVQQNVTEELQKIEEGEHTPIREPVHKNEATWSLQKYIKSTINTPLRIIFLVA